MTVIPSTVFVDSDEPAARRPIQLIIKNTGGVPIASVKIQPSCACATIASVTNPIAPGHSVTVQVPFQYPRRPGKFVDKLFVKTQYAKTGAAPRTEVEIVGCVEPTLSLSPSSIVSIITRGIPSVTACFLVRLLNDTRWVEAEVSDIVLAPKREPFDLMDVMLRTDSSGRVIHGTLCCHSGGLADEQPISGIVKLKAKSTLKQYDLELPFKVMTRRVRVSPDYIAFSKNRSTIFTLEVPEGVFLKQSEIAPIGRLVQLTQEEFHFPPWGTVVLATIDPREADLPGGFKFGMLKLVFSDGTVVRKRVVVQSS